MLVKFTINGKPYQVSPEQMPIDTSLNTFVRTRAHLMGTKFMCLEGGCGVCIVTVIDTHPVTKQRIVFSVNSCLFSVFSCHGADILTVEGLGSRTTGYHPIQERLAQFNGTQCGFCSPGMVMSMHSLLMAKNGVVTMAEVEHALAGNICRCTGYRPILDAFKSFAIDAPPKDSLARSLGLCKLADIEDFPRALGCGSCKEDCTGGCSAKSLPKDQPLELEFPSNRRWYSARTVDEIFELLETAKENYILVAGNTGHGVYRRDPMLEVFIDVRHVEELHNYWIGSTVIVGANVTLAEFGEILREAAKTDRRFSYCAEMARHVEEIAHPAVRNVGTIAGNLALKHTHHEFPSDLYVLFEAIGVEITIAGPDGAISTLFPKQFLTFNMHKRVLLNITLPPLDPELYLFRSYKVMPRAQNAKAYVNAAFLVRLCARKLNVDLAHLCYGGIDASFCHATTTEQYVKGKSLFNNIVLQETLATLNAELGAAISTDSEQETVPSATYRRQVAIGLLYRFILHVAPRDRRIANPLVRSGGSAIHRPLSSGRQSYDTYPSNWPLTQAMPKLEALLQTAGESVYVNDLPSRPDELHAAFVLATVVRQSILAIDASRALALPGVVAFYDAGDIPGENNFAVLKGNINTRFPFNDTVEEILCSGRVLYHGQPVGVIVAETFELANEAANLVSITYGPVEDDGKLILPTVADVLASGATERVSVQQSDVVGRTYQRNSRKVNNTVRIEGRLICGSQAHFTLEPQSCLCVPTDDGPDGMDVYSATQSSHMVQMAISKSLRLPQSRINVIVRPVGGSYGGKLSRGAWIASVCALAAYRSKRPVRLIVPFETAMKAIGKRIGAQCDYELDVTSEGKIVRLSNTYYQDFGSSNYESMAALFSAAFRNCYVDESWRLRLRGVLTDSPSSSWTRSPGTAESIATIETIMEHIAYTMGLDPLAVRLANIDPTTKIATLLPAFHEEVEFAARRAMVDRFNETNRWKKRGIAIAPIGHPIQFFGGMNAWVSIYHVDGSVAVAIGCPELGQGVNTKVAQVVAHVLGIPVSKVSIKPHTSVSSPNAFITGGSISTDLVAYAAKRACEILRERMRPVREDNRVAPWEALVQTCYQRRIDLTASYNTKQTDLTEYTVWALCAVELEVDLLTGQVQLQRVDILEDTGESMNPLLDIGQIEGAFAMALGLHLLEELRYDRSTGALKNFRTWDYKPPSARDIPVDLRVRLLQKSSNPAGVLRSKTTGEPAFNLGITVQFALRYALNAARRDAGLPREWIELGTSSTVEKVLSLTGNTIDQFVLH
ncbi:AGAP005638-PA-like protein [Anopheles sinensis]|uniref:Indole-3-acetaldehyde oxidase n=1 Tax=Anopheles sinensis TaxID=74873 RepID=A0A084WK58_ANOSI|nr:AGAP005638-PA-like protein [Anopheles sinensis]